MTSQGPNNGSTFEIHNLGMPITWTNLGNAQTSNDQYATASDATGYWRATQGLKATGFGFSIPEDAVIDGVVVEIEKRQSGPSVVDYLVKLVVGGTVQGDDKKDGSTQWPTSDAYRTHGGATDLWGLSLTAAQINASNFGVVISAYMCAWSPPTPVTAYIDHIRITVYYTAPINVADSGTGSETVTVVAAISVSDAGAGTEQISGTAQISAVDWAAGMDAITGFADKMTVIYLQDVTLPNPLTMQRIESSTVRVIPLPLAPRDYRKATPSGSEFVLQCRVDRQTLDKLNAASEYPVWVINPGGENMHAIMTVQAQRDVDLGKGEILVKIRLQKKQDDFVPGQFNPLEFL